MTELTVTLSSDWSLRCTRSQATKKHLEANAWLAENLPGVNFLLSSETVTRASPTVVGRLEFQTIYTYTFFDEYDAIQFKLAMS